MKVATEDKLITKHVEEINEQELRIVELEEENKELWGILLKFYHEVGGLMRSKSLGGGNAGQEGDIMRYKVLKCIDEIKAFVKENEK